MTRGSVDQDDERRPSIFDAGPCTHPLVAVNTRAPAVSAASVAWPPYAGAINRPSDSPSTENSDSVQPTSPREPRYKLSRQFATNHFPGPSTTAVPSPKPTPQARGSPAPEEQVHSRFHQFRRSTESSSSGGRLPHPKVTTRECVIEEHRGARGSPSHWRRHSLAATIPEGQEKNFGIRAPDLSVGESPRLASSQRQIQDLRTGSKRWSLPH
jgi:hypothetical protein